MVGFFIEMVVVGILGIIPIVLIDIYSNYKQNQITYRRKRWIMNVKRHNRSTPLRCLGLDMGLTCGCSFALFKEYCQAVKKRKGKNMKSQTLKYGETELHIIEFEKESDKTGFTIDIIGSKEDVEKLKQKIFSKVYTVFEEME